MTIANAHGWEIACPCDFSAIWTGGDRKEDVQIVADAADLSARPVSIFGCGVLTFHVFGLIRTPPGWNLYVTGSPNRWKDGIAPLTGVVETDWAPYTFTMNWRFTRPGHGVQFQKGEPICFFFPVPRGALDAMQPRRVPMEQNPELREQYEAWCKSRHDFHRLLQTNPPKAASDRWQRRYFQGFDMRDCPFPDHQAKLRLKPFAAATPEDADA